MSGVECGKCLSGYVENSREPGGNCLIDPCQQPHYGGCARTRMCTFTSVSGVQCGRCLPGYVENPLQPRGDCLDLKQLLDKGDPCAAQLPPSPGQLYSDNLSCRHDFWDNNLKCFNRSQLCDGARFCDLGDDEGFHLELICKF